MAKITYFLDTRKANAEGKYPLVLNVGHKTRTVRIPSGHHLTEEEWKQIYSSIRNDKPCNWNRQTEDISAFKATYDLALNRLDREDNISEMSVLELRDRLVESVTGTSTTKQKEARKKEAIAKKNYFIPYYRRFMESRETAGTREIYNRTLKKILEYDASAEKLSFDAIDRDWLTGFDGHLKSTTSANIRNMHFRNIRAVFNSALDDDITNNDPFRKFKLPKLEETRKRSLTAEQVRQLKDYPCEEWQEEYRDLFMLQFYLIGINLVDLLTAMPEDIVDGRFEYRRDKTHKLYSIKIVPEAMAIIKKYRGKKYLLSPMDRYTNHKNYIQHMNRALQKIGLHYTTSQEKKGKALFPDLTTYWSRHSWATIASSLDISMELIGRAMGHSWVNKTITSVYIDFDMKKVDEANRKVIDAVLGKGPKKKGHPKKAQS